MPQTAMIDNEAKVTQLFRHTVHPEWGAALLAWNTDDKYGFQFEDGKQRVFLSAYLHLLEEVDLPLHRATSIAARLRRKLGIAEASPATTKQRDALSFDQQLAIFAHLYPAGFADPTWIATHRRPAADKRQLKRHRDMSIETATRLATEPVAWTDAVALIKATDLVSSQQRKALAAVHPSKHDELGAALSALLFGDEPYAIRFERFVGVLAAAMRAEPSWQLATVIPALVRPDEHVCVRPTSFRAQAAWMAPRLAYEPAPGAELYERFRRMAMAVRDELVAAGHEVRDLLDVYDFMWATLRPSARAVLDELRDDDLKHAA